MPRPGSSDGGITKANDGQDGGFGEDERPQLPRNNAPGCADEQKNRCRRRYCDDPGAPRVGAGAVAAVAFGIQPNKSADGQTARIKRAGRDGEQPPKPPAHRTRLSVPDRTRRRVEGSLLRSIDAPPRV